jgi:hypothetical protein
MHFGSGNKGQAGRKIFYGDNGIFVTKKAFHEVGGFKEILFMEDYDFSIPMLPKYKVSMIKEPKLVIDARRHIKDGYLKTRIKWMLIKRLYLLGFSPTKLTQ